MAAYFGSRAILGTFDFSYHLFSDPFDPLKLAIDFGTWVIVYAAAVGVMKWLDR